MTMLLLALTAAAYFVARAAAQDHGRRAMMAASVAILVAILSPISSTS